MSEELQPIQPLPHLSWLALESDLLGLVAQREDCMERLMVLCEPDTGDLQRVNDAVEVQSELDTINGLIREYVKAEVRKCDTTAGAILELEARAEVRKAESDRLAALAKRDQEIADHIRGIVIAVADEFQLKQFRGKLHTINVVGNGGVNPLTIAQPEILPPALKLATLEVPVIAWLDLQDKHPALCGMAKVKGVEPNNAAIRDALEREDGVPGCRLEDRGKHLRIK